MRNALTATFITTVCGITLSLGVVTFAQEVTPQPSQTPVASAANDDKVQSLKDKLATKVAELRENQTRGFFGEIAALSKTSFTLVTPTGEIKIRYSDDVQVFKDAKKTEGAATDLKNAQTAAILGLHDADQKQLTAKVIMLQVLPTHYVGTVNSIDAKDGSFSVKVRNQDKTVDYERTTTSSEVSSSEGTTARSGLSRFKAGDTVHFWGNENEDDANRIVATRILRIPTEVLGATTEASPAASPTGSPRSTPRATPRATPGSMASPAS